MSLSTTATGFLRTFIQRVCLIFITLLLFLSTSYTLFGEGTRQLMPTAADNGYIQLFDQNTITRPFASFNCPVNNRLNIHVCNLGEKIYMGFRQLDKDVYFRLKDPTGATVSIAGLTPVAPNTYLLPTAGMGLITTYTQAFNGPSALVGATGYNAISYIPAMTGDYYVEFNPVSPTVVTPVKRVFTYFDITVATAGNAKINGRVWSRTWDFTTNTGTNQFKAIMYVYSDDGIVTSLNFNGMQPFGFTMSCNATGCANTGNPVADRASRVGNTTYPQYRIFLNDPDINCFPTGAFGNITQPTTITGCGNNRCINISVDRPGNIGVLLDLNGTPGYNPGTKDRQIFADVVIGTNCVPWDGLDGFGNPVTTGITFALQIDYFNGITHLPLFDVEDNVNGYIVSLVRPAGSAPRLFWDDAAIISGTALDGLTNLAGCSLATGCHRWKTRGDNNCTVTCPETINTWWYANIITENISYNNTSITADADTRHPGTGSSNDTTVCGLVAPVQLSGGITGATGGVWLSTGTGTFLPNNTTLSATYTPSLADITSGFVQIKLTSTGNGPCPAVSDSLKIIFAPKPTANANIDQTVCANNSIITLNGSFTTATGAAWSGGGGIFIPNNSTMNTTYTPTASEITSGSVTLNLTTTGNGLCPAATDQMTITINAAPTANAGTDQSICANSATATLAGAVTNATGKVWSGGAGSFNPNNTTLNAIYTPTAAEITAGTVTLTLTASRAGCNAVTDAMIITIRPAPTANAGINQSVCYNNANITLAGSVTNVVTQTWSGGSGTYNPNNTILNAIYTPTLTERNAGTITLTLTATQTGCNPATDQMTITITPAPIANAGSDRTVCANNTSLVLSGSVTGATSGTWSGGCGIYSPNANTLNATYTPCGTEVTAGVASLVLATTGNGNCNAATDTMLIIITPSPTSNAGSDRTVCSNNPSLTLAGTVTNTSSFAWSGGTGTFNPNNATLNALYTPSAAEITAGTAPLTLTANRATCISVTDQITIAITPAPTVNAGVNQTVCHNNPTVTLNGSVTVATGGIWSGGAGTFAPNANALNATYTPTLAERNAGAVTLTLTSTGNGTCNAVDDQMVITITPTPTVNANVDQTVCHNNSDATLNGSVTIATGGTWSGGSGTFAANANTLNAVYTPTLAERNAGTVTLTLTTTGNGNCNPVTDQMVITITPAPTANAGVDRNVCADNPAVILAGAVTIASGGIWSGGAGTFTPNNSTLNATYTPTVGEISAGSVTLTLTTTGNGICNAVSDLMKITITSAPTVNAGSDQIVCGSVVSVPLTGAVTIATGGTWTSAGSGSFSLNANTLNASYIASAADKTAGTITLTLTTTGNGLCNPVSDQLVVTFTTVPSINAGPDLVVCSNDLPIQLNASGSPAKWSGGTGTFLPSTSALNATYNPVPAEIAAGAITLTITTTPSGACPTVSDQVIITIPPGPIANAGADQTMCGNSTGALLNGSITNAASGFWSSTGTGSFIPNATTLNAIYNPSALDRTNGSVILTLITVGNGACTGHSDQMTLTIQPAITVSAGSDQTICADLTGFTLSGTITNAMGGIWSTSGSGIFTPNNITLNATYTPSAADRTTGTVTLTLSSTGNGICPVVIDNVVYTITPAPTVNANVDQTVCADIINVNLNGSATTATGGTWTTTGSGTFNNASLLNAVYTPSAADKSSGSVTFTLTTTGNGVCNAVSDQMVLTISTAPTVNAGIDKTVCADIGTVALAGSVTVATGGTWTSSGSGSFNNAALLNAVYTPSAADITGGTVTLTLTSTGNGSCVAVADQMIITITPAPTVNAGLDQNICGNSTATLNSTITVATGAVWSSNGTGSFTPSATSLNAVYHPSSADTAAGSVTITSTTTGNGTCHVYTDQMVISFSDVPLANAGLDQTICADSFNVVLNGKIFNAGGGIWTTSRTGNFFPSAVTLNASYIPSVADRSSGSVTLTLTSTSNGPCAAATDQMVITITVVPTVNAGADKTICADSAFVNLNGAVTIASGAIWTTSGSGAFTPNNTTLNTKYTPSANDKLAGSVTLTLTTTGNGICKAVFDNLVITITPAPTVNAGPDQTVCANSTAFNLNGIITVATGGIWTTSGTGVVGPGNTTLNGTYFTAASDTAAHSVTLTLTTTGNGTCKAVSDQMILLFSPLPLVNAGTDQTICADAAGVSLTGRVYNSIGGSWTSSGSGSFAPNNNTLNVTYIPSNADTTARTVTLTLTSTGNGVCNAASDQVVITINPVPIVNAGTDETLCADAGAVQLGGLITNSPGAIWSTNGSGNFSPDATNLNALYLYSDADTAAGSIIITLTSSGNTCLPVSDNLTINFSPVPTVNVGPDISVCTGLASVNLQGAVTVATGGFWASNGSGTFSDPNTLSTTYFPSAADETAGSVIITLVSTGNGGCNFYTDAMTLSFSAVPFINAGSDATVCTNGLPIHLNGSGTNGRWSGGTGTYSPNDSTLNAFYTPSPAEISAGTVTLTLTTIGIGTCTPGSDQVTFAILPGPGANANIDQTICSNAITVSLNGSVSIAGSGKWTSTGTGTFTNANSLNTNYTPSATDKTMGSVTFTLTTTGNGSCIPASDQMAVTIIPGPTIDAGFNQTVCGNTTANLNASFTVATGMQWTGGAGTFNPNNLTANTTYTPTAAEISTGSLTLTATTTGNVTCNTATDQMVITFTPAPIVNAGPDQNICASASNTSLNGAATIASGGFWTTSGSGVFSPAPSALNASYNPSAADTVLGSVTLTLTTTGNGSCNPAIDNMAITIIPIPIVNTGPNASMCSSQTGIALNGSVFNATGGTWTTLGTGTFSPSATTLNATYNQSALDNSNGAVNLMLTSTNPGPCAMVSDIMTVTIFTAPIASVNAGFDQTVCADISSVTLNGFIAIASGGTWTTTGTGIFSPNNTDLNAKYILSTADISNGNVTVTLTSVGNGLCAPVSDDMILTITPAPTVNANIDQTICADAADVNLNGSVTIATGGIWSSSGIGSFAPNAAALNATYVPSAADKTNGVIMLTLTTTGNGTCNNITDNMQVKITKTPTANAGIDKIICANAATFNINGTVTTATGGTWTTSGSGIFGNANLLNTTYTPSSADTSAKVINLTLTTTGNGLCNAVTDQVKITFNSAPIVNAGPDQAICASSGATLNGKIYNAANGIWSTSGSGTFSNINALNATYTPSQVDKNTGSVIITLTTTDNGVCTGVTDQMVINIQAVPTVNAGSAIVCLGTNGSLLNGSVLNASGGIWTSSGSGTFSPNAATLNSTYFPSAADIIAGTVTLTLTSTGNGNCSAISQNTVLTIDPLPVANAGQDQYICRGSSTTLTAQTSPNVTYNWTNTSGVSISTTAVATITTSVDANFVLTVRDAKGCFTRDTVFVGIYDLPTFTLNPNHCLSNSLIVNSNPVGLPAVPGIFQWYLNGEILTGQNTSVISPLSTGTYMITYSYGNCFVSASTNVTSAPILTHKNVIACENSTTAIKITSNVVGATYAWSTGQSGVNLSSININPVLVDTNYYMATVTDALGCSSSDSVRVIGIPTPILTLSNSIACQGQTVILNARPGNIANIDSLNPVYIWHRNPTLLTSTNDSLFVNAAGTYIVSLTIGQCIAKDTSVVTFNPLPVSKLPEKTKFCKETDNYTILDAGAGLGYTYLWTPSAGTPIDSNTTQTIGVRYEATYAVTITNSFNCVTKDSIHVQDVCPPRVFVPNAFIPGSSGTDQTFKVFGSYFANYKMIIFNRWGEVIFISTDRNEGWDGMYRGELMPVGVYPVVVSYEGEDPALRGPYQIETSVTVVR